ncbi:caspase family protein [Planktothrix agardhii 1806]|uniref:caspase family protein n=1 Tax=Planktothrix agardhii TaxID=1160 RepID=UPI001D09DB15|nr:caspase family protein [Planktothrix agardhii]MCF3605514.1 caspase family protein [Planktothrix agardhii 1033]MCB8749528.1 caspase family protein [Planktothrix agardhii 1810]MCF3572443.1 caspase family protein [Planktothrix agardhii 1805]MCF3584468.1 caspase family protein [Planktothrix agardhii 1803]MCF3601152.1 caspase family protein [Planktothrix agardhii 1804]
MTTLNNCYALIAGIANYQKIKPLPSTVLNDAKDIYSLLTEPSFCGYLIENVELLLDEKATKSALTQALTDLSTKTNADSTVLIYYSGHGGRIEFGPTAGEYLLPVDTVYTSGASLVETAISGSQFTEVLRAIPARKLVVIFDCCHAGGIGQPKDPTIPEIKGGLPDNYYDQLVQGKGRVIFASSRHTEQSYVTSGSNNSVFTKHLIAGLKGGITSNDGLIKIFDIFEYLQPKVTAEQPNQHPIFKSDIEENFPLTLYLGGQKGVSPISPSVQEEFRYDVYISYVDEEPDSTWVWDVLVPKLEAENLKVAVSGDVDLLGVARVINIERGVKFSKRTLVILSNLYLDNSMAEFENVLVQNLGIKEGKARLVCVRKEDVDLSKLPERLQLEKPLNLNHPRQFKSLIERLKQQPLPGRTAQGLYE